MTPASKHLAGQTTHALLRLEASASWQGGLDAESFRGFQLAGDLFLVRVR